LTEKIRKVLEDHEAYTKIVFGDDDHRVVYECKCGAQDAPDDEVWGRSWLINHQTSEIVKIL
jgi:hypothetical protein